MVLSNTMNRKMVLRIARAVKKKGEDVGRIFRNIIGIANMSMHISAKPGHPK